MPAARPGRQRSQASRGAAPRRQPPAPAALPATPKAPAVLPPAAAPCPPPPSRGAVRVAGHVAAGRGLRGALEVPVAAAASVSERRWRQE